MAGYPEDASNGGCARQPAKRQGNSPITVASRLRCNVHQRNLVGRGLRRARHTTCPCLLTNHPVNEDTSPKSVSSMKLHCDLGISQRSAWFMMHRIREAWAGHAGHGEGPFDGPVEFDETYMGGKRKNKSNAER